MMTIEDLNQVAPQTIFKTGVVINSPDDIYMTDHRLGEPMRYVACRGKINDWAIYIDWAEKSEIHIKNHGQKIYSDDIIRKLIPCDEDMLNQYRK